MKLCRVKNDSCEVHPHFQRVIGNCYAEYSIDVEDRDSFGSGVRVRADPSAWMYKVEIHDNNRINRWIETTYI